MGFLLDNCTPKIYDSKVINSCNPFDCDSTDLNDFFRNDVINYHSELLGKLKNNKIIECNSTHLKKVKNSLASS
ncbi:hypothetical protein D3C85_254080 [compost metagenome]